MAGMTSAAPLPPLPSRFWADLSTRDFAALQSTGQAAQLVAVLPVAAVEQHGPHLPLSVDATLLQGVIDAAQKRDGKWCNSVMIVCHTLQMFDCALQTWGGRSRTLHTPVAFHKCA